MGAARAINKLASLTCRRAKVDLNTGRTVGGPWSPVGYYNHERPHRSPHLETPCLVRSDERDPSSVGLFWAGFTMRTLEPRDADWVLPP